MLVGHATQAVELLLLVKRVLVPRGHMMQCETDGAPEKALYDPTGQIVQSVEATLPMRGL